MSEIEEDIPKPENILKRRGNMITHATSLLMLASLLGIQVTGTDIGFATKSYVDEQVADVKGSVDKILELNLTQELEKLHRYKCMNPASNIVDSQIVEKEREYRELTGVQYVRPSCEYLVGSA